MRLSFRNKLVASILLVIIFFGSAAAYAVFYFSKINILEDEKEEIQLLIEEKANEVKQIINQSSRLAEAIAQQFEIVEYMSTNPENQDENILQHLKDYNLGQMYSAIYLMNTSGQTVVSTDPSFVGKNYSFRDYFQHALAGQAAVDVALGVTSKKLGYYFSHPVRADDRIVGVAIAKLKPEVISNSLTLSGLSQSAKIMLVDDFGVVVSAKQDQLLYHSLFSLSQSQKQQIIDKKRYQGVEFQSLDYEVIKGELTDFEQVKVFELAKSNQQAERIISLVKIPGLSFWLLTEEDMTANIESARQVAYLLSVFVALAALFAAISISLLAIRLIGPLKKMSEISKVIAKGDLDQRIEIGSKDEIGQLADSFNKMIDQLQKTQKGINQKVGQRTKDLEKLNRVMTGRELKMLELKQEILKLKGQMENKK